MGLNAASDVRFDFEGSLELARRLYTVAEHVDTLQSKRVSFAETALTGWEGPFGTEFAGRIDDEGTRSTTIATQMRQGACEWAARWAEAMNEQNAINHARESKRVEDDRSGWDNFVGGMFGHDDLPADPPGITVPSPPNFYATGTLTEY